MSSGITLMAEAFGHVVLSYIQGVTEHCNPRESEYMSESSGYSPLSTGTGTDTDTDTDTDTGQEWYLHGDPDDECINQEYINGEATSLDHQTRRLNSLEIMPPDTSSMEENDETQEYSEDENEEMAWTRLRPSTPYAPCTVCKSMCTGASISLLTATIIGSVYMMICYLSFITTNTCEFYPKESIPVKVQWERTISAVFCNVFLYPSFFVCMLFLFRRHQLKGIKRKLVLVICIAWFLDTFYRLYLQAKGISHGKLSTLQKIPLYTCYSVSVLCEAFLLMYHFRLLRRSFKQRLVLFFQMTFPFCSIIFLAVPVVTIIYPLYNKQSKESTLRLVIAVFAPLIGILFKVVSRILVQRQESISHPGYSCALLAPLYGVSAIMFRVLQADLDSVLYMAILGSIHGAIEIIERFTMALIDRKRTSAFWRSFRTPRRERLMADIAIMSRLYESTAIVSVNGLLYLYRYIYLKDDSVLELLQSFAMATSVQLVIEWFFTSISLAIETRYQNIAVMAVWRRRWKRHILQAIATIVLSALWVSANLLDMAHERFEEHSNQPCNLLFS